MSKKRELGRLPVYRKQQLSFDRLRAEHHAATNKVFEATKKYIKECNMVQAKKAEKP